MTDEHIHESYFIVTYEAARPGGEWRRINEFIKGCPGVWWAAKLAWYEDYRERCEKKAAEYKARGRPVPISERYDPADIRFINASPITKKGFEALEGEKV